MGRRHRRPLRVVLHLPVVRRAGGDPARPVAGTPHAPVLARLNLSQLRVMLLFLFWQNRPFVVLVLAGVLRLLLHYQALVVVAPALSLALALALALTLGLTLALTLALKLSWLSTFSQMCDRWRRWKRQRPWQRAR